MKPLFSILFIVNFLYGQNLISNSGFEDVSFCPCSIANLGENHLVYANGWSTPTFASADLICKSIPICAAPYTSYAVYQYPNSGDNMAGIYIFEALDFNYREYLQFKLSNSLPSGNVYELSLFVNTAGSFNVTSCVQIYFSNSIIENYSSYYNLGVTPQLSNPSGNYITDTLGWTELNFTYISEGGEQYITIGCFDNADDIDVTVKDINDTNLANVYLMFDDISLIKDTTTLFYVIPNVFTPNNDGVNDIYYPEMNGLKNWEMFIYNRWGKEITKLDKNNPVWNGINDSEGVYFYYFQTYINNELKMEKGFIQLFR